MEGELPNEQQNTTTTEQPISPPQPSGESQQPTQQAQESVVQPIQPSASQNGLMPDEDITAEEAPSFDVTVFEGQRVPIASVEKRVVKDHYATGDFQEETNAYKWIAEFETAPLRDVKIEDDGRINFLNSYVSFPQEDGTSKPLTVNIRFNFQPVIKDGVIQMMKAEVIDPQTKEKKTVDVWKPRISKHQKASLWKFLSKIGAQGSNWAEIKEKAKGKLVLITTTPSKKQGEEDRRYLSIVSQ